MESQNALKTNVEVEVSNVGGIGETSVQFSPGVTLLVGRNATNRTSFLQAVMAALGSDAASVKGGADKGEVTLMMGEETYQGRLWRTSEGVTVEGSPYLEDPQLAELFAFLLESNEARRAVVTSQDLRELVMRPVNTEAIQNEVDELIGERDTLEAELERIEDAKTELPELEAERSRLESAFEELDADIEDTREAESAVEDKFEELRAKRAELDDIRYDIETEEESLAALRSERHGLTDTLEELPETQREALEDIEPEIEALRERRQALQSEMTELRSVIEFNEEQLENGAETVEPTAEATAAEVTAQLLPDEQVTCWTCGSEVEREQIEDTLERLRELSQQKLSEVDDIKAEIANLNKRKREVQETWEERDRIESRLESIRTEITRQEETIESLRLDREELIEDIERIESEVDELEDEAHGEVLERHKEVNELEYELGRLETELEDVTTDISELEDVITRQEQVEAQLNTVRDEITALRTKIEQIEADAVEKFNEHMDTVLDRLEYSNLDRIWIERREREARDGRRKVTERVFELHVVRTADSGVTYEDTVDHLSESEREVTGLVFALAGYLAHELYEEVPFMLLDSLEAIDSERIASLITYLESFSDYLVVALLPEDALALPGEYERITDI